MPRIRITAYIDTDDLSEDYLDLDHKMGVTAEYYEMIMDDFAGYDDVSVELVDERRRK